MDIEAQTSTGKITLTLSSEQVEKLASEGNKEARKEILEKDLAVAKDIRAELNALYKYLGV